MRAWVHTEENKRRTLQVGTSLYLSCLPLLFDRLLRCSQRNDIAMAITKTDVLDFLIDIVPREDMKSAKKEVFLFLFLFFFLFSKSRPILIDGRRTPNVLSPGHALSYGCAICTELFLKKTMLNNSWIVLTSFLPSLTKQAAGHPHMMRLQMPIQMDHPHYQMYHQMMLQHQHQQQQQHSEMANSGDDEESGDESEE